MSWNYRLYGCRIETQLSFHVPVSPAKTGRPHIRILKAPRGFFAKNDPPPAAPGKRVWYESLPNGSFDIRFFNAYQCRIVPNGKTVYFQKFPARTSLEYKNAVRAFPFFLRNNILSFCLLKFGIESLHGSAVKIGKKAVGFIGESTYGKSTLAASFLQAGCPVLTDDLLAIQKSRGRFWSAPGIPHLKLRKDAAKAFLPASIRGIGMTPGAIKFIFPLKGKWSWRGILPMGALYVLQPRYSPGSREIRIRSFPRREAAMHLIRAAHNLVVQSRERLNYQFKFAGELASQIPIRAVSYPRDFKRIPELRDLLLRDIRRQTG